MCHTLGKWVKKREGSTAVEFSLVAVPFIMITIGIIELALMFTAQSLLHEAAFTASRLIRTGQLQQSAPGGQEAMFQNAVCDFASAMIPCAQIQYNVETIPSFADADDAPPEFDEDGNLQDTEFDPGAENDIVLVRLAYNYPVRTPLMQPLLANRGTNRTMFTTIVLQTEPYQ